MHRFQNQSNVFVKCFACRVCLLSLFQINGTWFDVLLSTTMAFRLVLGATLDSQFLIVKHRLTVAR